MSTGRNTTTAPTVTAGTAVWLTRAKWTATTLLPLAVFSGCSAGNLAPEQTLFFTVTSAALALWALRLMSDTFVAISLPIFYIVLQVGKPIQILGPWTLAVGWVVVGGLVFANMMMRTGLAKRLAIWALYITRGSFTRLLWGILLAGFIIAPAIPSIMGKAALISVVCMGICEALHLERRSKAASAVILAGFIGVATSKMGLLTGGADIIMYVGQMSQTMGRTVGWGEYFLHNFPLSCVYGVLSLSVLLLVLRPKIEQDSTAYVAKAHADLGRMDSGEKRTGVLILLLILLLLTDRIHGLDAGWVIILLSFAAFLPGMGLMTEEHLQKLSMTSVFFVVGSMSIGAAAKASGADKMLVAAISPLFEGQSGLVSMLFGYVAGVVMNLLLTPLAAYSAMTVPLTELALQIGVNPLPVLYAFSFGLDQYVFPYEYAVLLFFYATGWVEIKHIMLVFSIRCLVAFGLLAAVAYPYWNMLGLFTPLTN